MERRDGHDVSGDQRRSVLQLSVIQQLLQYCIVNDIDEGVPVNYRILHKIKLLQVSTKNFF